MRAFWTWGLVTLVGCAGDKVDLGFGDTDVDAVDTDGAGGDTLVHRDTADSGGGLVQDTDEPIDTVIPDDTLVGDDSGDTGDTGDTAAPGTWMPDRIDFVAEFAVDAAGAIHGFKFPAGASDPSFYAFVTNTAGRQCILVYGLHLDAFGYDGQVGLDAGIQAFLDRHAGLFGFVVADGRFDRSSVGDCGTVRTAFWQGQDQHLYAIGGGPLYGGLDLSPAASVLTMFSGSGIATNQILGGTMQYPVSVGGTDHWPAGGFWTHVSAAFEPESDLSGRLVLQPAVDAWSGSRPAEGFYRWYPSVGFQFVP